MSKPYKFKVTFSIAEVKNYEWESEKIIDFNIEEKIPGGVDPVKYVRSRISEELKRHSASASFDWKKEDVEYDDLETGEPEEIKDPF